MNIQTFICNFAYEMNTTYFKLHRLHLPDCYSKRFTVLLDTIWLIAVMLGFACLRNDLILAFLIQKSEKGNRWTQTRINYHPCITSEMTNQVCWSPHKYLLVIKVCYTIYYIKAVIGINFLSFQVLSADEKLYELALQASGSELISYNELTW